MKNIYVIFVTLLLATLVSSIFHIPYDLDKEAQKPEKPTYIRKDELNGKIMGYTADPKYIKKEKECIDLCDKDENCKAFAFNAMNLTNAECLIYDKYIGYEKPEEEYNYNYYAKEREENDGYYRIGKRYVRFVYDDPAPASYSVAKKFCESEHGWLATDAGEKTHKRMVDEMASRLAFRAWIGLSDENDEEVWDFEEGLRLTNNRFSKWIKKWRSKDRNCVILYYADVDSGWQHENCGYRNHFFCNYPVFI